MDKKWSVVDAKYADIYAIYEVTSQKWSFGSFEVKKKHYNLAITRFMAYLRGTIVDGGQTTQNATIRTGLVLGFLAHM